MPQTLGSAKFYGTAAPVSLTAAAAQAAAAQAAPDEPDFHAVTTFGHHAHEAARPSGLSAALQPPSPAGTRVVNSIGAAIGFNGISHLDQRNAGTGIYASTNNNVEPPDQGLCAGNGFVVETINDALAVYDENGNALTAVTALNQFYNLLPFFNRVTGFVGDDVSDPKCYYDPVGKRFIQTILEVDSPGNFGQPPVNRTHILIAVSQTSDPTGSWNLFTIDSSDDGLNGTPATRPVRACQTSRCWVPTKTACSSTPTSSRTTQACSSTASRCTRLAAPAWRAAPPPSDSSTSTSARYRRVTRTGRSGDRYSPRRRWTQAAAPSC